MNNIMDYCSKEERKRINRNRYMSLQTRHTDKMKFNMNSLTGAIWTSPFITLIFLPRISIKTRWFFTRTSVSWKSKFHTFQIECAVFFYQQDSFNSLHIDNDLLQTVDGSLNSFSIILAVSSWKRSNHLWNLLSIN